MGWGGVGWVLFCFVLLCCVVFCFVFFCLVVCLLDCGFVGSINNDNNNNNGFGNFNVTIGYNWYIRSYFMLVPHVVPLDFHASHKVD